MRPLLNIHLWKEDVRYLPASEAVQEVAEAVDEAGGKVVIGPVLLRLGHHHVHHRGLARWFVSVSVTQVNKELVRNERLECWHLQQMGPQLRHRASLLVPHVLEKLDHLLDAASVVEDPPLEVVEVELELALVSAVEADGHEAPGLLGHVVPVGHPAHAATHLRGERAEIILFQTQSH